jgi:hypothetical protein
MDLISNSIRAYEEIPDQFYSSLKLFLSALTNMFNSEWYSCFINFIAALGDYFEELCGKDMEINDQTLIRFFMKYSYEED